MIGSRNRGAVLLALLAISSAAPAQANAECRDLRPRMDSDAPSRGLQARDLVTLRDIGAPHRTDVRQEEPLLSLSPDRTRVAFHLMQANPEENRYCLGVYVLPLNEPGGVIEIDRGGELIRRVDDFRGRADVQTGVSAATAPLWSSDGQWIAYRRRDANSTQIWIATLDGRPAAQITHMPFDIERIAVSSNNQEVLFAGRPGLIDARAAIAEESLRGFHYDDRFSPSTSNRPFPLAPIASQHYAVDVRTGAVRAAEAAELDQAETLRPVLSAVRNGLSVAMRQGSFNRATSLVVEDGRRSVATCDHQSCTGRIGPIWWRENAVRFLRHDGGPFTGTPAVYEWLPGTEAPRLIFRTENALVDCVVDAASLVCLAESSTLPRRIVRLDPDTGQSIELFNPNPEFDRLLIGRTERIRWTNALGFESMADLVLPIGYSATQRYPTVIVQYNTRGFLRGGTGDEYPVHAFATRGYAVLSISRPESIASQQSLIGAVDRGRANLDGFHDRRNAQATFREAIAFAVERGVADPDRILATGFSDGASTVQFELAQGASFAAVALSQCCWSENLASRVGPRAAEYFRGAGYPMISESTSSFWDEIAPIRHACHIGSPMLFQISDTELLSALDTYTALREHGAPVDMFVFPDEYHVKWQPAHRLAVYQRSLDWFDFWLGRPLDPDSPSYAPIERAHWAALRDQASARDATSCASGR